MSWALTSVAAVVTFGRFYIRWKFARLYWDDSFSALALLCLVAFCAISDVPVAPNEVVYLKLSLAYSMVFWTTLYLVKGSFMVYCWQIFKISATFRKAWWFVMIYTFFSYWPLSLGVLCQCGNPSKYADPVTCSTFTGSSTSQSYTLNLSILSAALHVSSDCFILALPLFFIKRLQMSTAQKLSAAAVFALIIVDILMGLIRNIGVACSSAGYDLGFESDFLTSMGIIEPALAVIVCALPVYRVVLSNSQTRRQKIRPTQSPLGAMQPTLPISNITSRFPLIEVDDDPAVTERTCSV